ncbi:MAG: hypothetical protein ACOC3V_03360 [bacterium]
MLKRFDIDSPEGDLIISGIMAHSIGKLKVHINTVGYISLLDRIHCYLITVDSVWLGLMVGRDFEKLKFLEKKIKLDEKEESLDL